MKAKDVSLAQRRPMDLLLWDLLQSWFIGKTGILAKEDNSLRIVANLKKLGIESLRIFLNQSSHKAEKS